MNFLNRYSNIIEKEVFDLVLPKQPANLYEPLKYFLKLGGKRIRPILTLLAGEIFGAKTEDLIKAALAVELFHNFTLIHDDIMDKAPLRRNQETVHERWNSSIAILAGDVLFVKAYEVLGTCPENFLKNLFSIFSKTAREVCEGQQMDMDFEEKSSVTEAEYLEMIRLKTSVLLGCALEMGAIMGNSSEKERQNIYNFGIHIGLAFQIQDDILDLFGDPEKVGKQIGGDVICNKKTLLSIIAKSKANEVDLKLLNSLQLDENLEFKIKTTANLYERLGVRDYCEQKMIDHYNTSINYLNKIENNYSKKKLINLANYLMNREY
jgi:geranylgeranyl diphosphate synthase type II